MPDGGTGTGGAGGTSQGATGIEVVGTGPHIGDDVWSLLQDLVMHDIGAFVLGSAALGDVAPALTY
jgi:hypothetical protein